MRTVFHLLILLLLMISASNSLAQQSAEPVTRCSTMDQLEWIKKHKPEDYANMLKEFARLNTIATKTIPANQIYYVPVIFHIITDGVGSTNLSQSQIQAQLNQLNADFRRMNSDTTSNWSAAADTRIEFCLAVEDENGNLLAEPGIMRWTNWGASPRDIPFIDNTIKPATIQDPSRFFNFWSIPLSSTLLGYAQFPGGPANTDGVVCTHTSIGSIVSPGISPPYNLGRTGTHEVGHYLNLRHIWGDCSCCNDFVGDTPEADGPNYGCPLNSVSCSSPDMVENYMDYTDDDCMNLFTQGQATRMQNVFNSNTANRPYNLGNPPTLCAMISLPPVADFDVSPNPIQICPNTAFTLNVMDSSSRNPTSWQWNFSGAGVNPSSASVQNPSITVSDTGTLLITLIASNVNGSDTLTRPFPVSFRPGTDPACSPPVAAFNWTPDSVSLCLGSAQSISFEDVSSGAPNAWNWTFVGANVNPNFSSSQNPTVTVSDTGTLVATLVISNLVGSDTITQNVPIYHIPETDSQCLSLPCLSFNGSPLTNLGYADMCYTGCPTLTASFDVFANEGFLFPDMTAGVEYQFSFCDGYDENTWAARITIAAYDIQNNQVVPNSAIATVNNCVVNFTCPTDGDYIAIISLADSCGGPLVQTGNGTPSIQCVSNCPPSACDEVFTDRFGPSQNYALNETIRYTLCPTNPTFQTIEMVFTDMDIEFDPNCSWDYLEVYNGADSSAPLLGRFCGTTLPDTILSTDSSGCLTALFVSDFSITAGGWEASIHCVSNGICIDSFAGPNALTGTENGTGGPLSNGVFETDGAIESTQQLTNGAVIYDSGVSIELQNGFEVQTGASIDVIIDGCGNGIQTTRSLSPANDILLPEKERRYFSPEAANDRRE